eukprot:2991461-Pleurochrysis_carterae.AAC.3
MHDSVAISWLSKKQATVVLFSCETEIVAASEATKNAVYRRALFAELGLPQADPTPLSMDNKSAIDLAYNPGHHQRTKHIHRHHFFLREKVESHDIAAPFVCSADNMADFSTKKLPPLVFFPLRGVIMNVARSSLLGADHCRVVSRGLLASTPL